MVPPLKRVDADEASMDFAKKAMAQQPISMNQIRRIIQLLQTGAFNCAEKSTHPTAKNIR